MKKLDFSKSLFWDVDINKTDFKQQASFIVGRVLESGDLGDYKIIRGIYGEEMLKAVAREHKFNRARDVNFWSLIFGIAKENFLCTRKPSLQVPRAFSML